MGMYDLGYYEKMLRQNSGTAEHIAGIRWKFVKFIDPKIVLDYGSGCNFLTLFKPGGVIVDSYDIGTINGYKYPQTGIRHERYDLIFFNDVLEHIDWENEPDMDIDDVLFMTRWVAVTVPILPEGQDREDWKHYKEGEHLTYFTVNSLMEFFEQRGFDIIHSGRPECPPREDVGSFVFFKTRGICKN